MLPLHPTPLRFAGWLRRLPVQFGQRVGPWVKVVVAIDELTCWADLARRASEAEGGVSCVVLKVGEVPEVVERRA